MNYYPFHTGDYLSATRHLTWDEDAAYRRLLDLYYMTEKPLTSEARALHRLVVAVTDEQRSAVDEVLKEFFTLTTEGWFHVRCDAEIAKMRRAPRWLLDVTNTEWAALRQEVFARDKFRCSYCGAVTKRLECDHVLPLSRGGLSLLGNLATSCVPCNRSKGAKSLEEWRGM